MSGDESRLAWIDTAKGAGIVLVVIGHAWRGLHDAGLMDHRPQTFFGAVDLRIYAFHMPLFFLLSGFFLTRHITGLPVRDFIGSRVLRLVYPLLLWTYVFALAKYLAGEHANQPLGLDAFLASPIPGRWHFWFLWALFVLQTGLVLMRPVLMSDRWRRAGLWGLLLASVLGQGLSLPVEFHYWTSNALRFLPYLVLGMVLADLGRVPQDLAERHGALLTGVFLLTLTAVPALAGQDVPYLLTAAVLSLSGIGMTVWLVARCGRRSGPLGNLGRHSMIIFLSHTIFSAGLREALIGLGVEDLFTHMILATGVGLLLPVVLQRGVERWTSARLIGA